MIYNKSRSEVDLSAPNGTSTLAHKIIGPIPIILISSALVPHCSRRFIIQPNWDMYLGESFKGILEEHEINPIYYDEVMNNVDAHLWYKAIDAKFESMYSN